MNRIKKLDIHPTSARWYGSEAYQFKCQGCKSTHVFPIAGDTPTKWGFNGSLEKPTFTPSQVVTWGDVTLPATDQSPAKYIKKEVCHFFITDGRQQFLGDCTHALAGQTVDMVEIKD